MPQNGISLQDKIETTRLMLKSGCTINEMNCVRKHISKIKGGNLSKISYPRKVVSLIISDVVGDRVDVIASGPTSADETTFFDCKRIIGKYGLEEKIPRSVLQYIQMGIDGKVCETPKKGDRCLQSTVNIIIGNNRIALMRAERESKKLGYNTRILSFDVEGEPTDVARRYSKIAREIMEGRGAVEKPACLISGGETTPVVKGKGLGGRNQELALAFLIEMESMDGIEFLSAGSDGTDGPTDVAGAMVTAQTMFAVKKKGLDPVEYLLNNDSYNFFREVGGHIITGPTETNVMDIHILILH
jgi:glycerate-2-kinase